MKPLGGDAKGRERRAEPCLEYDFSDEAQHSALRHVHLHLALGQLQAWNGLLQNMSTAVLAIVLDKICSMQYCSHERREITCMLGQRESGRLGLLALYYFATQYCMSSNSIPPWCASCNPCAPLGSVQ